jgi:phospholipid/cholesterol/gamma-HCH transport system substrate-binding protein
MQQPSIAPESPLETANIANLKFKAIVLLLLMVSLVCAAIIYVMVARGVFEQTQQLVLLAEDSEGVNVGMDLTFSGFAVGRVRRIELAADGKVRIVIDLAKKDAKWIRTSSVFTMERGLVGDTRLKAFSGDLSAPPLPANAVRSVLQGDTSAQIPRLLNTVQSLAANMEQMTHSDAPLNTALANLQTLTGKLNGKLDSKYGVLGAALGGDEQAKKVHQILDNVNSLLGKADAQVFGKQGVMVDAQASVQQLHGLLVEVRASLKKVDAVLIEAQGVGANLRTTTNDLGPLREQVEQNLRKVETLVNEINRKWPFARETEVKLP